MSREIKFKVWSIKRNKMYKLAQLLADTPRYLQIDNHSWGMFEEDEPVALANPNYGDVLLQYTGLKDKNDKEIYEGDIVIISETEEKDVVKWTDGKEYCIGFGLFSCLEYEVIGNIYENPNLLKEA